MNYYTIETSIGTVGYQIDDHTIVKIDFNPNYSISSPTTDFSVQVSKAIQDFLKGTVKTFNLPLRLEGTPFQKKVWEVIQQIPYGTTLSYKAIGKIIHSKGYQAIGQACGKNPIPLIIPCHRVITNDGSLGGFAGGRSIKEQLLLLEQK